MARRRPARHDAAELPEGALLTRSPAERKRDTLAEAYVYLRLVPDAIQAWREADELEGRELMRDGRWLA